jgi:zinc transport system substrate-binding protein
MKRTISVLFLTYWVIAISAASCSELMPQTGSDRSSIAVSILPQAWLVAQIGGSHVEVTTLIEPGGRPETYQPTDAQVSRVMRTDVYFYINAVFESGPWFGALKQSGRVRLVDVCQDITPRWMGPHPDDRKRQAVEGDDAHDHEHDGHSHTGRDPHVWLTPKLLKTQAQTVARVLAELDPANKDDYIRNLGSLEASLDELDEEIRLLLDPHKGRAFFVFHPAWGYFADEYGLRQVPIEVAGKDPSDHELTQLQQMAQAEGARVIFVQPQVHSRSADAVANAIGSRVVVLDPLAKDVAENLLRVAQAIADSYQ